MNPTYPTVRIRMPFARGQGVLYEDYLAIENIHSFGLLSEENRAYYDEIRWVLRYQKRDWYRLVHALLWGFPALAGVLLVVLPDDMVARIIGLALALPTGMALLWSAYRFLAVPRTVAAILSPRGTVEIGTDWPRKNNRLKDAGAFFDAFLTRLEVVAEIPAPPPPAAPPAPAPVDAAAPPPAPAADSSPPVEAGPPAG